MNIDSNDSLFADKNIKKDVSEFWKCWASKILGAPDPHFLRKALITAILYKMPSKRSREQSCITYEYSGTLTWKELSIINERLVYNSVCKYGWYVVGWVLECVGRAERLVCLLNVWVILFARCQRTTGLRPNMRTTSSAKWPWFVLITSLSLHFTHVYTLRFLNFTFPLCMPRL